jgi:hypothetical protein
VGRARSTGFQPVGKPAGCLFSRKVQRLMDI